MSVNEYGIAYNDYKPVDRNDYGVRVARNGYDASTCADSDLLFNSGWRIIQIVKVIDLSNKHYDNNSPFPLPSGWEVDWEKSYSLDSMSGGGYGIDEKWFYLTNYNVWTVKDPQGNEHRYTEGEKVYHGLGYVPLFFDSEFCSDTPGYILLTNVDIRQDVDYPYTNAPSYYYGGTQDYGIKSKSYARKDIPEPGETRGCGINTSIQSKMVMAVKTEKSKTKDKTTYGGGLEAPAKTPSWAVPSDQNSQTTKLTDYEPFGFFSIDGVIFMTYVAGVFPNQPGVYTIVDQAGIALMDIKKSLVVLRSPMVAPDIEELTIQ